MQNEHKTFFGHKIFFFIDWLLFSPPREEGREFKRYEQCMIAQTRLAASCGMQTWYPDRLYKANLRTVNN